MKLDKTETEIYDLIQRVDNLLLENEDDFNYGLREYKHFISRSNRLLKISVYLYSESKKFRK